MAKVQCGSIVFLILYIWILQSIATASNLALAIKAINVKEELGKIATCIEVWHIIGIVFLCLIFVPTILGLPQWWKTESIWWHKILTFSLLCTNTWPHYRLGRLLFFYIAKNTEQAESELDILQQRISFNGDGILQSHLLLIILVLNSEIDLIKYLHPWHGEVLQMRTQF